MDTLLLRALWRAHHPANRWPRMPQQSRRREGLDNWTKVLRGSAGANAPYGSSVTFTLVRPLTTLSMPLWYSLSGSRWVTISSIGNSFRWSMRMATG
jgi:hypothetical protein